MGIIGNIMWAIALSLFCPFQAIGALYEGLTNPPPRADRRGSEPPIAARVRFVLHTGRLSRQDRKRLRGQIARGRKALRRC